MKQGAVLFAQESHERFRSHSTQRADRAGGPAPYLIVREDMRRAWPYAQTTEAFSSRKPLRTRFGTLSAPCCQISRECVLAPAGGFASDAISATNAALSRTDARMRRGECPPMTLRPHLRTHSRVFWAAAAENPSQTLATKRNHPRNAKRGRTRRSSLS